MLLQESGTQPHGSSSADEVAGKRDESKSEVGALPVADRQAAEAGQSGQLALDSPAVVDEPLAALNAAPGDPGRDAASPALAPAAAKIVALVGVQPVWSAPRATPPTCAHARHRIEFATAPVPA
jgi:hypothetical protein